jgi:nucleoside-diphosphate-sugar epimerase
VGLRNCLDLAVRHKAQFFYASSSSVYGEGNKGKLLKEDYVGLVNQLGPRACFAEAKRFGETLVENYRLKYGLDTKTVRIFNCYGPRMRLSDGRMMPEVIKSAMNNKDIVVYGEEKSVGSYFYISDLIKGIKKVMESTESGPINMASEWKNKFSEIVQTTIKLTNSKSKVIYQKGDAMMGEQNLADITLAKEKLGWFPIVLLDEGIRQTIDYLKAQQGIRNPGDLL